MANRARRGGVWGAAAAACLLTMGAATAPAEAAPVAASSAAIHCGNPILKAWYDSDQFGTYLKVWFQTDRGCPRGRGVANLGGQIYCKTRSGPKLVYRDSVANKKAPAETQTKALPPKSTCKSFWAEGTIIYRNVGRVPFRDTWRWNWGDYPA